MVLADQYWSTGEEDILAVSGQTDLHYSNIYLVSWQLSLIQR